jgi:hypothetical protein
MIKSMESGAQESHIVNVRRLAKCILAVLQGTESAVEDLQICTAYRSFRASRKAYFCRIKNTFLEKCNVCRVMTTSLATPFALV